jgi:hypothetical protein
MKTVWLRYSLDAAANNRIGVVKALSNESSEHLVSACEYFASEMKDRYPSRTAVRSE